ncbi:MAG: polysaccharide biosynthesis protein [Clostridia bacterium]|nr:polysaccharide biosynthesis protein [Clostridia bacterium]
MEFKRSDTKKVFFSGVLLLSVSTVLVKIIGLIYKIPMLSYLGSEGMGYFNSAYEIYALFCIIATAGLPVALSVLISEARAKGHTSAIRRIYRASVCIFLVLGILGTLLMWIFADAFCTWIKSESAYDCILSIAPTVFFVCVSSAIRGYFQGFQRMLPTALSQLIEAVGKLLFGLLFAHIALECGAATGQIAAAAGWGLTLGTALSTLYLLIEKRRCTEPLNDWEESQKVGLVGYRDVWRSLGRLAIPMTLGASLVSLTKLIDMAMILRRLQSIGYSEVAANEAYGSYTTLALSVFGLLPTLLNSIALPLVPMLSAAIASGDSEKQKQMVETSYRLSAFFAIPSAIGISAFARPVLLLLFQNEPQAVMIASQLLSLLGISVFLSCMITATNSVLHAYQSVKQPILSMAVGAGLKILVSYILIGIPSVGLMGAPISSFFCNGAVVLMNLHFASKKCGMISVKKIFVRPLVISCAAIGIAFGIYLSLIGRYGEDSIVSISCIFLAVVLYLLISCFCGGVSEEDIRALPMGEKVFSMMTHLRGYIFHGRAQKEKK